MGKIKVIDKKVEWNIPVKDRTEEQHLKIIKENYSGSVRDYLLSMGEFKDE